MAVQLDRDAARVFEHNWHQGAYALGREQAARVLEAEPERLERRRLAAALRVVLVGVNRRDRIDQVDDRIEPELARDLHPIRPAGQIVPRLGDARLSDAVRGHTANEEL